MNDERIMSREQTLVVAAAMEDVVANEFRGAARHYQTEDLVLFVVADGAGVLSHSWWRRGVAARAAAASGNASVSRTLSTPLPPDRLYMIGPDRIVRKIPTHRTTAPISGETVKTPTLH